MSLVADLGIRGAFDIHAVQDVVMDTVLSA